MYVLYYLPTAFIKINDDQILLTMINVVTTFLSFILLGKHGCSNTNAALPPRVMHKTLSLL